MLETVETYTPWKKLVTLIATGVFSQDLTIDGSFSLSHLRIRSLPAAMNVSGDLDLRQCQRLSYLGKRMKVGGSLLIGGKVKDVPSFQQQLRFDENVPPFLRKLSREGELPIHVLPEELSVGKDLIIRGATYLQSLPKKLEIGGSLFLQGCRNLTRLPDNLLVPEHLTLIGCPKLKKLPENLTAKSLLLIGCGVEYLPQSLDVDEVIHIEGCSSLTLLPELPCFSMGKLEKFFLDNCPIIDLPAVVAAKKDIKLSRLPIEIMKDSYLGAESIHITRCKNLKWVSAQLNVGGQLNFNNCNKLEGFVQPMQSITHLNLNGCESLQTVPQDIKFNTNTNAQINLTNCGKLESLPDTEFNGRLELMGSGLKTLPDRMSECRVSWRRFWVTPDIIFYPERLTPGRILTEPNAEIRRLMLEKVGIEKILANANASTLDVDTDAGGQRWLIQINVRNNWGSGSTSMRYLRCSCPSTARQYLLPVPPNIGTCHAAAAWLAGFDNPQDYRPVQET